MNVYSFFGGDVCEREGSYYNRWIKWDGKGMATRFAKEGARVVITGRTKEKLEETKLEIEQFQGKYYQYKWMCEIPMIFRK